MVVDEIQNTEKEVCQIEGDTVEAAAEHAALARRLQTIHYEVNSTQQFRDIYHGIFNMNGTQESKLRDSIPAAEQAVEDIQLQCRQAEERNNIAERELKVLEEQLEAIQECESAFERGMESDGWVSFGGLRTQRTRPRNFPKTPPLKKRPPSSMSLDQRNLASPTNPFPRRAYAHPGHRSNTAGSKIERRKPAPAALSQFRTASQARLDIQSIEASYEA